MLPKNIKLNVLQKNNTKNRINNIEYHFLLYKSMLFRSYTIKKENFFGKNRFS